MRLLSVVGCLVGLSVSIYTLSTALYTISNQLESHTRTTKTWITRLLFFIIITHLLLWIGDDLSFYRTFWSLGNDLLYLEVMREFPQVKMTSLIFIASCIASVISHFTWYQYFTRPELPPHAIRGLIPNYKGHTLLTYTQLFSFFGILIWSVPLLLFLCINVNEYASPLSAAGDDDLEYDHDIKPQRKGLAKYVFGKIAHFGKSKSDMFSFSSDQGLPF